MTSSSSFPCPFVRLLSEDSFLRRRSTSSSLMTGKGRAVALSKYGLLYGVEVIQSRSHGSVGKQKGRADQPVTRWAHARPVKQYIDGEPTISTASWHR